MKTAFLTATILVGLSGHASAQTVATPIENAIYEHTTAAFDAERAMRDSQIQTLSRESRGGIAGAAALSAIPISQAPGKTTVGLGAGAFRDQSAIAFSAARTEQMAGNLVTFSLGASTTGRDNVVRGGVSITF